MTGIQNSFFITINIKIRENKIIWYHQ